MLINITQTVGQEYLRGKAELKSKETEIQEQRQDKKTAHTSNKTNNNQNNQNNSHKKSKSKL